MELMHVCCLCYDRPLYFFQEIKGKREHVITSGALLVRQDYVQSLIFCFCFYVSFCPFVRMRGQSGLAHVVMDGASQGVFVGLRIPISDPHPHLGTSEESLFCYSQTQLSGFPGSPYCRSLVI